MSIVLKENEWAKKMIDECSLGKKPFETLRRIARYYIDEGFSKDQIRKKMTAFFIQCDTKSSTLKINEDVEKALRVAIKYPAIDIDGIDITDAEMKKIDALSGKQIKRLAFTLLCLSKYWNLVNPKLDGWVKDKDNQIMALANINTSLKRQGLLYWTLREEGMIQLSKSVDNNSIKVLFTEGGKTVMTIRDFRNLGYQYLMYHGEPYFECKECGIITKYNNPNKTGGQKYCRDCAAKIYIQQSVNSVMRQRERKKAQEGLKSTESKNH